MKIEKDQKIIDILSKIYDETIAKVLSFEMAVELKKTDALYQQIKIEKQIETKQQIADIQEGARESEQNNDGLSEMI